MIELTEKAQLKVKELIQSQKPGTFLRVGVRGGGCSGMLYDVKFDDKISDKDQSFEIHGVKVVCDLKSSLYLVGMTVDYSDELLSGGFKFVNPNAKGSCGCGTSFTV